MTVYYERDAESGEYALLDRQTDQVRTLLPSASRWPASP